MKRLSLFLILILSIQVFSQVADTYFEQVKIQERDGICQKTPSLSTQQNSSLKSTYDSYGNLTLVERNSWDANSNQWVISSQNEYTYDSIGNLTMKVYYQWSSNILVIGWKNEYSYNSNREMTIDVYNEWTTNTNQWVNRSKSEYTYDWNGLGINEHFNENVKIYPNPINDNSFTIETPFNHTIQLNLMDFYGRTILTKDLLQSYNRIKLENISDGLYFIQLLDENKIRHQQKIIKRN